jgi:hypothetical protein
MSNDRRNRKALMVADQILGWGATLITDAVEASKREIDEADGYPTKTPGASTLTGSGTVRALCACGGYGCDNCAPSQYTATERAAERRYTLIAEREELRDALDAWVAQWEWIVRQARKLARTRLEHLDGQRCSGQVDATCTNMAAAHRHPDTEAEEVLVCDGCYLAACRTCRRRGTDGRYIDVDGTPTPSCEACYRRTLRAGRAA